MIQILIFSPNLWQLWSIQWIPTETLQVSYRSIAKQTCPSKANIGSMSRLAEGSHGASKLRQRLVPYQPKRERKWGRKREREREKTKGVTSRDAVNFPALQRLNCNRVAVCFTIQIFSLIYGQGVFSHRVHTQEHTDHTTAPIYRGSQNTHSDEAIKKAVCWPFPVWLLDGNLCVSHNKLGLILYEWPPANSWFWQGLLKLAEWRWPDPEQTGHWTGLRSAVLGYSGWNWKLYDEKMSQSNSPPEREKSSRFPHTSFL